MAYPDVAKLKTLIEQLVLYSQQKHDYGAPGIEALITRAECSLQNILLDLQELPVDSILAQQEPDELASILALRPAGPRRLWNNIEPAVYREKLEGALLGRFAGCTLGVPVEGWSLDRMEELARENEDPFPPTDYWKYVTQPLGMHYNRSQRASFTRGKMNGVPVDDDLAYTLLGLLIVEEHGPDFTTADVGKAWLRYLPIACTAEEVTLRNLKAGIPALEAGSHANPFTEWIGADIRSDPWGYLAPGFPELAAKMAYRDAYLSHRRQGIYGAMFFSAAIAAAFTVREPLEAIQIALTEIPAGCQLAHHVRWALDEASRISSYRQAHLAVEQRFAGMPGAHTLNNACLTIFGLAIGGTDFSRVIGETVAMGMDNDCTAATAGSIIGAVIGKAGLPSHWYHNFNNTIDSYLIGVPQFQITDILERFIHQAMRIHASHTFH